MVSADLTGVRGEAEAGIATRTFAAGAFVSGRLPGSTANSIEDTSIRRAGVHVLYRPNKYLQLGTHGTAADRG